MTQQVVQVAVFALNVQVVRGVIRALRVQVGVKQVRQLHGEVPRVIDVDNHAARQAQAPAEDNGEAHENGDAA